MIFEVALTAYILVAICVMLCHGAATDEMWRMFAESPWVRLHSEWHPHTTNATICLMVVLYVALQSLAWPLWSVQRWRERQKR